MIVGAFIWLPLFVSAGVFSIFSGDKIVVQNNPTNSNSQNLSILDGSKSAEFALGGGSIEIVDESALVPNNSILSKDIVINKPKNGKISVYRVREGDTLSQIADMFDVSVNTIRWANDFSGSIQPGQELVILPVTGITHTIKHGGTIKDVAEIYDADVEEIALFNGLSSKDILEKGQEIIVPHVDNKFESESSSDGKTSSAKFAAAPSSNVSGGYFQNPIPGGIITQALHGYNGIDIGVPYGTPIYAAASGKVITSKSGSWNGGYGNYIVISHPNGTQTLYSHQSSNAVYVGQVVEAGEVIGYVGSTGRSTGNHLHFEVRGADNPLQSCSVGSRCYID
ncbi:M23 family metallopeptidase [Candidatus Parcubacteria bacterium]|nr:M23 family metallopeptidase [Candidatus Parcubacteria bacterium]